MKPKLCAYCLQPLGAARLGVHSTEANRRSGDYHTKGCFQAASEFADVLEVLWNERREGQLP